MNLGKAESRSISLPVGLWDLVDGFCEKGGRTKFFRAVVEEKLRAEGEFPDVEELDLMALIREAKDLDIPVAKVISEQIEKCNQEEVA